MERRLIPCHWKGLYCSMRSRNRGMMDAGWIEHSSFREILLLKENIVNSHKTKIVCKFLLTYLSREDWNTYLLTLSMICVILLCFPMPITKADSRQNSEFRKNCVFIFFPRVLMLISWFEATGLCRLPHFCLSLQMFRSPGNSCYFLKID